MTPEQERMLHNLVGMYVWIVQDFLASTDKIDQHQAELDEAERLLDGEGDILERSYTIYNIIWPIVQSERMMDDFFIPDWETSKDCVDCTRVPCVNRSI